MLDSNALILWKKFGFLTCLQIVCHCVGCGVNVEIVPQPLLFPCVYFFFFSPKLPNVRDLSGSFGVPSRGHCSFPSCRFGVSYGKRWIQEPPGCLELSCIIFVKWLKALWEKIYAPRLMVARLPFTEISQNYFQDLLPSEVKSNLRVPVLKDVWHGYLKGPPILWNRFANVSLLRMDVYHLLWLWLSCKCPVNIQISYLCMQNWLLWNKLFVYRIALLN